MNKIRFRYADRHLSLNGKSALKDFLVSMFKKEKAVLCSLTYVFCSDEYLLRMNRDFLKHDTYTDIITFALSESGQPIEAEIYISLDRVQDNANTLGTGFKEECLRVIFHGVLHLCGYRDKKKSEIIQMRSKEEEYLRLFGKL